MSFLKTMKEALLKLLQAGFNPYEDNSALEAQLFSDTIESTITDAAIVNTQQVQEVTEEKIQKTQVVSEKVDEVEETTIKKAFELGLRLKEKVMNKNSFTKYKSRINRFTKWLKEQGYEEQSIRSLLQPF